MFIIERGAMEKQTDFAKIEKNARRRRQAGKVPDLYRTDDMGADRAVPVLLDGADICKKLREL